MSIVSDEYRQAGKKQKNTPWYMPAGIFLLYCYLNDLNVDGAWTFITLFDIKLDSLAFVQRPESGPLDGTVMNKNIAALVTLDETEPFFLIKPLYFTLCQSRFLLSQFFQRQAVILLHIKIPPRYWMDYPSRQWLFFLGSQNMNT